MKFQNIRRVGVLVFVLFLALTLTLILTAPGQEASAAEDPTDTPSSEPAELMIMYNGRPASATMPVKAKVGETVELSAQWYVDGNPSDSPQPDVTIWYKWEWTGTDGSDPYGASFISDVYSKDTNIEVWGVIDTPVTVTVTAYRGASTVEGTASCTLEVVRPELKIMDYSTNKEAKSLTKKIGDDLSLCAEWISGKEPSDEIIGAIEYEWKCSQPDAVKFESPEFSYPYAVALQETTGTAATITVTAIYNEEVLDQSTVQVTVTTPALTILENDKSVGTSLDMKLGEEKDLTFQLSLDGYYSGYIYYKCEYDSDAVFLDSPEGKLEDDGSIPFSYRKSAPAAVSALRPGTTTVTVTLFWTDYRYSDSLPSDTSALPQATYTLDVNVLEPEWKITTDGEDTEIKNSLALNIGEEKTLKAEVTGVTGASYTWSVEEGKDSVVSVGENDGKVTAIAAGTAKVTVTAKWTSGGKAVTASKTLTVTVAGPELSIGGTANSLRIGQSAELAAECENEPVGVTYNWTSSVDDDEDPILKIESASTDKATVTLLKAPEKTMTVTVTLTASWGTGEDEKIVVTYPLTLVKPELTIKLGSRVINDDEELSMQIGGTPTLTAQITENTAPWAAEGTTVTPTYEWKPVPVEGETFDGITIENGNTADATIKASKPGSATIQVTVTWAESAGAWTEDVTVTGTLEITVSKPKLEIYVGTQKYTDKELQLEVGGSATLEAELDYIPAGATVTYTWVYKADSGKITVSLSPDYSKATVTVKDKTDDMKITVVASWGTGPDHEAEASCTVTIPVPVTGVKLNKGKLTLKMYESETLTPTVEPDKAINKNVTWSSSNEKVATVDKNGKVTGVSVGTATITVTTDDGGKTAKCEVEVTAPTVTGLSFGTSGSIVRSGSDPKTWELEVSLLPAGAVMGEKDKIVWDVKRTAGNDDKGLSVTGQDGRRATLKSDSPGVYTVTATYMMNGKAVGNPASIEVTVSGITLTRTSVELFVDQSVTIAVDGIYGFADNNTGTTDVDWNSSDPATVSVLYGELTGWKLGNGIVITATKNGYTAECVVNVVEDKDVVIGPLTGITAGKPLRMSDIYEKLNQISINKTQEKDEKGDVVKKGSDLAYITNVTVSTSQGTLYYNYSSEANTGDGVGSTDRFAWTASGAIRRLSQLYFVPRQGFQGTAEITFTGWSESGVSFSGVIKIEIDGTETNISYRTRSDTPVYFLADDFDAYVRGITGRGVNYVIFSLPQASKGVLYYNYTAGEGLRVSASTRFAQAGRYIIGDVCFVPNDSYVGDVEIDFRGEDTAGQTFTGRVVVSVSPSGADPSGVYASGERGGPVTLHSSLFNAACQEAIHDTLNFVTFKLPALEQGMLYYNYRGAGDFDSRVNATTRYFYSGVPGINNITFVPASNATGRIAISYTGYGVSGATFDGTLYINMDEVDRTTIYYFVSKNNYVALNKADFNNAGLYRLGADVDYVRFGTASTSLGTLRYNYQSSASSLVSTYTSYYLDPNTWQRGLSLIAFRAGDAVGTVTIPYTAYSGTKSFTGSVVIQVGALTPADTEVSCNTGGRAWLSSSALNRACSPAMSEDLSYIEITGLPDPEMGRLYLNYTRFGTGTEVKPGDRFYCVGSPNINQLTFVPHARFTGEAEITYIGYNSDSQEQVSGRIIVNVTSAKTSTFNDMDNYAWAIDSVEFLRLNGTVEGVGDNRFAPSSTVIRGDFVLMLVRAYGFTASGGSSFTDVPADSYYADAIRIASVLGIISSPDGLFHPRDPLSRQDAMVMIFNALKASGKAATNGLTADLSAFHDREDVASYALEAMGSLVQMGVVKGNGKGYLKPLDALNRAEAAILLHTIMTL